jgi:hypothetical protein
VRYDSFIRLADESPAELDLLYELAKAEDEVSRRR